MPNLDLEPYAKRYPDTQTNNRYMAYLNKTRPGNWKKSKTYESIVHRQRTRRSLKRRWMTLKELEKRCPQSNKNGIDLTLTSVQMF